MSYQDFLALGFIQVNHKVLQEEYNLSYKRAKEYKAATEKYQEH